MATLTRTDVEHVAYLARLGLGEDELARLEGQLNHILDQYAVLATLDTEHIPPTAQTIELANILRVLLKHREAFVPFSDELAFTDDYLDIEVVRFGEKLRVVKEIAEDTLPVVVPSMLLQPLIENSIKHGLEPRIGGGTVTLRSRLLSDGRLLLEVEDDGIGMESEPVSELTTSASESVRAGVGNGAGNGGGGIGMRNVRERMEVLYGSQAEVEIVSRPGRGTKVTLVMPVLEAGAAPWAQFGEALQATWADVAKAITRE